MIRQLRSHHALRLRTISPCLQPSLSRTRNFASVADDSPIQAGESLHGFTCNRLERFSELELTAIGLTHDKTGAQFLHLARDDPNNVFAIGFKTNPPDATGVPHILEHTTLCGSQKYPIRDPFTKMLPRSLSNFMNAFTSSDYTTYPFATTNTQDFRNLMSVYLDATLHPLLKASDFTQEGWRIGPVNPKAILSKQHTKDDDRLAFKGVVYNEMKGQMSDSSYLYYIRFFEHLIPSLNNSGGDPQKITDLTHTQLVKFHADNYHPSKSKIFTYGSIPLAEHLEAVDQVLKDFDRVVVHEDHKSPIDFSSGHQSISVPGPIDPLMPADAQYKTSITWKTGSASNMEERFALGVLNTLLMDGYGSPLYQALIESGLGADFTPNTGFSPVGNETIMTIGLTGVQKENVNQVGTVIKEVFTKTQAQGFDRVKVDGILHQLELALKHKSAQFGMGLFSRVEGDWQRGVSPFDTLAWNKTIDQFKAKYAQPGYLEGLIDKYLLTDNSFAFTMEPSATYSEQLVAEEAERLSSKIQHITSQFSNEEEAQKHLAQQELKLMREQEEAQQQDLSCLPSVHVADIPRKRDRKTIRKSQLGDVSLQWRETETNGLTYFRAINVLKDLPNELRVLIPLFNDAIMRLGTKDMPMEQIENAIKLKTGGISVGYHLTTSSRNISECEEGLLLSGHAFDRNVPDMLNLLGLIIRDTNFDGEGAEKMIQQLLQTAASGSLDSVAETGHAYAIYNAVSGISTEGWRREQVSGLSQVALTSSLAKLTAPGSLSAVIEKLKIIQKIAISNTANMRISLHCGPESTRENERNVDKFLQTLPQSSNRTFSTDSLTTSSHSNLKTFFPLPYQVYYSGVAVPTVPYTDSAGAAVQILSQLLTHNRLHHEIREKGGAYAGGSSASGLGGSLRFYSYRDPNPQNTLRIVKDSGLWARDRAWTAQELEEAKISTFQGLDAPQSVNEEGMTQFVYDIDPDMQQRRREQLLDVTADQVRAAADRFLVQGAGRANVAVLGPSADWLTSGESWRVKKLAVGQEGEE